MSSLYSDNAEKALLGSIILDNRIITELVIEPDYFLDERNRLIFITLRSMLDDGGKADTLLLSEKLLEDNLTGRAGGLEYVSTLASITPTSVNYEYYAQIIIQKWQQRELVMLANRIIANPDIINASGFLDEITAIKDKTAGIKKAETLKCLIEEYVNVTFPRLLTATNQPRFGFPSLDTILPLTGGKLYIVAGKTSHGKTLLMMNVSGKLISEGKKVLYAAYENPEDMVCRLLSQSGQLPLGKLFNPLQGRRDAEITPEFMDDIEKFQVLLGEKAIKLMEQGDNFLLMSLPSLADIKYAVKKEKPDVIMVDYFQRLPGPGDLQVLKDSLNFFANLAIEQKTPLILGSQVRRLGKDKDGDSKEPTLDDLKETGYLEQFADVVIFCYWKYADTKNEKHRNEIQLNIAKNKLGPIRRLTMNIIPEFQQIYELGQADEYIKRVTTYEH